MSAFVSGDVFIIWLERPGQNVCVVFPKTLTEQLPLAVSACQALVDVSAHPR